MKAAELFPLETVPIKCSIFTFVLFADAKTKQKATDSIATFLKIRLFVSFVYFHLISNQRLKFYFSKVYIQKTKEKRQIFDTKIAIPSE
jgi:hypothetical protein